MYGFVFLLVHSLMPKVQRIKKNLDKAKGDAKIEPEKQQPTAIPMKPQESCTTRPNNCF
jgi:hypothetical protein